MDYSIFRHYDIRGIYPSQLNEGVIFWVAKAFGKICNPSRSLIVGHDIRQSSLALYPVLVSTLRSAGFKKIVPVGFITTPMYVFLAERLKAGGAVMLTASHNPKKYGGLKFIDGKKLPIGGKEILKKIIDWKGKITPPPVSYGTGAKKMKKNYSRPTHFHKKYADFLSRFIDVRKRLKVVIDCSNGSVGPVWQILRESFRRKGIEIMIVNQKPDGNFPAHGPNPLAEKAIRKLKNVVLRRRADLGIIFDGDGDRVVFVDDKGRPMPPVGIWYLLLVEEKALKTVYSTASEFDVNLITSTLGNAKAFKNYLSPVGYVFLKKILKNKNADLGFEYSGHYYFKDFFFHDSGIVAAIKIIGKISKLPYKFSDFSDLLPRIERFPQINLKCRSRQDAPEVFSRIGEHFKEKGFAVSYFEGVSVNLGNSWFNLRLADTEDLFRLNLSGVNRAGLLSLKREVLVFIGKLT
ncbi:MAG: Phosphomannomutase [Candidatus Wolfebacteria bacterium GW2011_GWC1_43_10]|uniref:Phosphomannomutase n=1 Tax=Candidatus Wolfebacteria bacterium GW2011_GWC1_43_10 TaxID=1619011 RepID=A0A0G1CBT2_9BACT|nr:MAG: Phosphomannomutase [Candidatus Wolfebacteria bacterium GW2011_GWC1_43_10]KKT23079.1 MAG: Phosphomannomutase [Parcubacteria group bacterium GW2011_GWB1_43_8b]